MTEEKLRSFHDDLTKLLRAAEGDDLLQIVATIIDQKVAAIDALMIFTDPAKRLEVTPMGYFIFRLKKDDIVKIKNALELSLAIDGSGHISDKNFPMIEPPVFI